MSVPPALIGLAEAIGPPLALLGSIAVWGWWQTTREATRARNTRPDDTEERP